MRVKLSDAFELQMGKTPARNNLTYWNGTNKWVSIADLGNAGKYIYETKEKITEDGVIGSGIKIVPKNTVIMSFKLSIGKTAITAEDMFTNEAIMAFIDKGTYEIDNTYLYHMFSGMDWSEGSNKAVLGMTLNKATLSQKEIEILSLEQQKEVVTVLDQLDELVSLRKQQLEKLEELVKSRFVELFGDPVTDSMKWGRLPLSHYLESIRYGTSTPPSFSKTGYEFIRATNIKNGKIVNSDMKYISEEEAKKIEKCKVLGGEMIIVRSGVNAGDTCVIADEHCGQYAGYDMILVFTEKMHPVFVNVLINTEYMDRVVKPLTRRAAQPHLNSEQVQSLPIIQVPYAQQKGFVAFVEQTDKSKLAIQKSLEQLEILKKALMQQYFG